METVGFIPEPNCGRGTVSIIWSCVFTLFLATWTSLHYDIDESDLRSRIFESLFCLGLPELVAVGAVKQLFHAITLRKAMCRIHGWEHWSLKHSFLIIKSGVVLEHGDESKTTLTDQKFLGLALRQAIEPSDFPTSDQIDDRSKQDWLSKTIAIIQSLWFAANLLSRLANHFQVSLLEDLTAAYVLCGLVIFIAWFHAPKEIHEPFVIRRKRKAATDVPAPDLPEMADVMSYGLLVFLLGLFVAIHLGAWHYPFPTAVEMWLWRACSIATFVLGVAVVLITKVDWEEKYPAIWLLVPGIYVLVRLTVMGVTFSAFRMAPAGIYEKPSWTPYWAHIGS